MRTGTRGRATARRPIELVEPRLLDRDVRAPAGPRISLRALRSGLAHLLHVLALLAIDLVGVALAVYLGLVVRALLAGDTVHWGVLWDAVAQSLPFIALVLYLVFASNGLYSRREAQPASDARIEGAELIMAERVREAEHGDPMADLAEHLAGRRTADALGG